MEFDYKKDYGEQLKTAYENNEKIPEEVCRELCWKNGETFSNGSGRWTEYMTVLYECQGFYYGLDWERGLTECQEDEYWSQVPTKYKKVEIKTYTFEKVKEVDNA